MTNSATPAIGAERPFLSIVIPVYNVEPYLETCLDACLTQDVPPAAYELVCVDDGSPDRCGEILDGYAARHENVRVLHKTNGGLSDARNAGMDAARGSYIWFVDSDDFIGKNVLGDLFAVLRRESCDELAVPAFAFRDGEPYDFDAVLPAERSETYKDYLWTRLYRLDVIREHGVRFNPEVAYVEDNAFCTLLNPHIRTRAAYDGRIAIFYRLRQGSLSTAATEKRITSYIAASADMLALSEKKIAKDASCYTNMYLWMSVTMTYIASLPPAQYREMLQKVKDRGVFPLRFRPEYRPHSARPEYGTKKKLRAFLRDTSYTRIGFFLLRLLFGGKK